MMRRDDKYGRPFLPGDFFRVIVSHYRLWDPVLEQSTLTLQPEETGLVVWTSLTFHVDDPIYVIVRSSLGNVSPECLQRID